MKKNDNTGMLSTFVGGTLWGVNGVMGNYLFLHKNVTTPWLIPYRLILAGFLLLSYLYYKKGSKIFDILKNPKDLLQIVLFGLYWNVRYTIYIFLCYSVFKCCHSNSAYIFWSYLSSDIYVFKRKKKTFENMRLFQFVYQVLEFSF